MVQPAEHVVYAIHDYEIPGRGFLPLKAGDLLFVVDADASGWWLGVNLRRQQGIFPSTYTLPYVFSLPPNDLVHDAELILLAREFAVDLTSGAPAPLHEVDAAPPRSPRPTLPSAEFLREELQRLLLERETARKTVMNHLSELLDTQQRRRALQQQAAETQKAYAQQRESERQKVQKVRNKLRDVVDAVEKRKSELLSKGKVPSSAWYRGFADVVAAAATTNSSTDAVSPREGVWQAALKDAKAVVQKQEEQLAALSLSCAEREAGFTAAATALQKRIEWRDGKVAVMLAYWADVATTTKSTYISRKTERDAAMVVQQQKAAQLRRRLEDGKERFAEAKETYRRLKREAQTISDLLKQQETLDVLSREIAQVDSEIAARQQQQQHAQLCLRS